MALSELIEERLSAYEGLIRAIRLDRKIIKPIYIAVDEWNVWYRSNIDQQCEEPYNLEDALVVAMHLNAFIRHCAAVRMANIAQIVNVISPIHTRPDGLFLHSTFYPFELYSRTCGETALDVWWDSETFSSKQYGSVRLLDVSATLDSQTGKLAVYVVNRSENEAVETTLSISEGHISDALEVHIVNGSSSKSENSFDSPEQVCTRRERHMIKAHPFVYTFEPHSVTAVICDIK
jgi:alpha-N-arabinofuranosidase